MGCVGWRGLVGLHEFVGCCWLFEVVGLGRWVSVLVVCVCHEGGENLVDVFGLGVDVAGLGFLISCEVGDLLFGGFVLLGGGLLE